MKRDIMRREALMKKLAQCGNMIRGSINCVCSKCNRAHCICKIKGAAKAYRLTYKDRKQKTCIVYIPKNRLPEMRRLLTNYSQARGIIDQLIAANVEIFKKGS